MKNILLVLTALLISTTIFAQVPNKMSYQTVIRNASNALVTSQGVGIQISILQGSATGSAVYVERHFPNTNANGLASFEIGSGAVISGTFANINWGTGTYFIKTETDPNGGSNYTITGTSQFLSVPYALHAKTADGPWETTNGTDLFYLDGYVGIGPTDPNRPTSGSNFPDASLVVEDVTIGQSPVLILKNTVSFRPTLLFSENSDNQMGIEYDGRGAGSTNKMYVLDIAQSPIVTFESGGDMGVGTTAPSYKLHVNGTAGKPGGGSWTAASDKRLKDQVVPFKDGLTSIMGINPVKFHYNEKSGIDTEKEYVGVIAQELKEVAPYMVGTFEKDAIEYFDVDNSAMTYLLVNAVQEQQAQIETLNKQLEVLTAKLNLLLEEK